MFIKIKGLGPAGKVYVAFHEGVFKEESYLIDTTLLIKILNSENRHIPISDHTLQHIYAAEHEFLDDENDNAFLEGLAKHYHPHGDDTQLNRNAINIWLDGCFKKSGDGFLSEMNMRPISEVMSGILNPWTKNMPYGPKYAIPPFGKDPNQLTNSVIAEFEKKTGVKLKSRESLAIPENDFTTFKEIIRKLVLT